MKEKTFRMYHLIRSILIFLFFFGVVLCASAAKRSDLLSEAKYLQDLSASYNMQVYLLEKKEDVYWRWLFFVEK